MQTVKFTLLPMRQRGFAASLFSLIALLVGLSSATKVQAQPSFNSSSITITSNPNGASPTTTTYVGQPDDNNTTPNLFQGKDLGNGSRFSLSTGSLLIDASFADIFTTSTRPINNASLQYRVYLAGTPVSNLPNYSVISMPRTSSTNNTPPVTFERTNAMINLLTQPQVLGGGTYTVDIQYVITYTRAGNVYSLTDPSNGQNYGYTANFQVIAPAITPPGGTSTWVSTAVDNDPNTVDPTTGPGSGSTVWTLAGNWSNGVPTRFSDAIIPGKDIAPTGVAPLLNDPNNPYEVRTLTLQNSSNANRATLQLTTATLVVFGDLNQPGGGIAATTIGTVGTPDPSQNSTIVFAGANQVVRGSLIATDVRIEGSGIKSVVNRMTVYNTLIMNPNDATAGVLLQTAVETSSGTGSTLTVTFDTSTNTVIDLNGSGKLLGPAGVLPAETNVTFVQGVMRANRILRAGVKSDFGNIGLDITTNKSTVADVIITRIVGDALNGPIGSSAKAVKRQFQVGGEVNSTSTTDPADIITSTIVFHYLDSGTGYNELNGNTTETNLVLFRTVNNGVPFVPLGGTADATANTVTRAGLTTINTVTLGDRLNPLPVTLTFFDAKRAGTDAIITWQTASEQNNKGYNVQVSADGVEFRTLGFVASSQPNSSTPKSYSYTDTEKNKAGLRYYRLQQVDLDGKTAYFTPRAVAFDGGAAPTTETASLLAYPNPFTSNVRLSLNSALEGKGTLRITDLTGRTVDQRNLVFANGSNDIDLAGLSDLKSGTYVLHLTLPSGIAQNLKVVKQ